MNQINGKIVVIQIKLIQTYDMIVTHKHFIFFDFTKTSKNIRQDSIKRFNIDLKLCIPC